MQFPPTTPLTKSIMTIELAEKERTALIQLIDLAVKAGGLNVAQAGATLAAKLADPQHDQPEEEGEE